MFVYVTLINQIKKYHSNYKQNKKSIIIVPKKNVKFANKRNKIRRQIKDILRQYYHCTQSNIDNNNIRNRNINNSILIIKYLDKETMPSFQDLKKNILTKIATIKQIK